MKAWVKQHETTVAIISATIVIISVLMGGMWTVQSDYNNKFLEQNIHFNDQIRAQNDKFYNLLKEVSRVDKESALRDKDIELLVVKSSK